jgi:hypothetical protein
MSAIDWSEIYNKYKGMWVALKDDEVTVVGNGKTLREALNSARKKGVHDPIMHRVPTEVIPYVGSGWI